MPLIGAGVGAAAVSRRLAHRMGKVWGRVAMRIFGVELEVEHRGGGSYPRPAYVFTQMNQTSLAESFLAPAALPLPHAVFANLEFALVPLVGWIAAWGGVLVVRQWPAQRQRAARRATLLLERGTSFYISIEGARSRTGALQPYKKGPVVMAIASGAPLVPVYFFGARAVLPYGEWRVRPGRVRVVFGEPKDLSGRSLDERDAIVAELRAEAERELAGGEGT